MKNLKAPSILLSLLLFAGCATDTSDEGPPPDAEEGSFSVMNKGKGDANGFEDFSPEAFCVLNFVNSAKDSEILDTTHSLPGKNIIAHRAGADGKWGTGDDDLFDDLEELDGVSFVGRITFSLLNSKAKENGFCPKLGEETLIPGEEEDAKTIADSSVDLLKKKYATERPARRDAHAKSHGCVKAFFEVDNSQLAAKDQIGLFASNQTFPAWIRFSNGSFTLKTDADKDVRGMAIKLMDVPGEKVLGRHKQDLTQDFLLINGSTFFVRTPKDYIEFSQKAFDGNPVSFFIGLNPFEWNLRELFNLLDIVNKEPVNPLTQRYWSTVPYAYGTGPAVKYSARPCDKNIEDGWPKDAGENIMRDNMVDSLNEGEACFEFMVQFQDDPIEMPVEDSTITWDEDFSPFITVARLKIPKQEFSTAAQDEFCEHLSFNPWHTLPEHKPIGNINRIRRTVYDAIDELRHNLNEKPRKEPTSHDIN